MAEGTYEYELQRAELLGIDPPDKDEFDAARQAELDKYNNTMLAIEEMAKIAEEEQLKNTSGKMDEINKVLSITQKRINKFKTVCGSLTNLLKIRSDKDDGHESDTSMDRDGAAAAIEPMVAPENNSLDSALDTLDAIKDQSVINDTTIMKSKASDMQQKMSCQFDALDSLLAKAENAQYSMAQQNRDMKRLLK